MKVPIDRLSLFRDMDDMGWDGPPMDELQDFDEAGQPISPVSHRPPRLLQRSGQLERDDWSHLREEGEDDEVASPTSSHFSHHTAMPGTYELTPPEDKSSGNIPPVQQDVVITAFEMFLADSRAANAAAAASPDTTQEMPASSESSTPFTETAPAAVNDLLETASPLHVGPSTSPDPVASPSDTTHLSEEKNEPWSRFEILPTVPPDHAFFDTPPAQPSKSFSSRYILYYTVARSLDPFPATDLPRSTRYYEAHFQVRQVMATSLFQ